MFHGKEKYFGSMSWSSGYELGYKPAMSTYIYIHLVYDTVGYDVKDGVEVILRFPSLQLRLNCVNLIESTSLEISPISGLSLEAFQ